MRGQRDCLADECDRPVASRGYCNPHYAKALRKGELTASGGWTNPHKLSEVDLESRLAACSVCGPTRVKVRSVKGKIRVECRAKAKEQDRAETLKKYGLTGTDYMHLIKAQDGRCAICGNAQDLVVDHCHSSGQVRGLLCHSCNVGIGFMRDSPAILRSAAEYLGR